MLPATILQKMQSTMTSLVRQKWMYTPTIGSEVRR
jgi:hypothetical protein